MKGSFYCYEDIPEPFITLLARRGISGKEAVESFLFPRLEHLPSPFLMKGMQDAVELIISALATNRNIVLWGDYDVDGTTGVALLVTFFRSIGREVVWHIPDRIAEGYGLNLQSLKKIGDTIRDYKYLLITIDCGISNFKEVEELRRWGSDVVVTDHHQIPDGIIPPCAVINPLQDECGFIGEHLAGAGVAFYLAAAVRAQLRDNGYFNGGAVPNLKQLLPYTALGTIADVAPLGVVNRTLVRAGLEALQATDQHGLCSLLESSDINGGKVFSEDIGFLLGPKINAAGRMAHAELAVRLLISKKKEEAKNLAQELEDKNNERKKRCLGDLEKALTYIDPIAVQRDRCCILIGPFHHGTLGITASRLMERLQVPVIILSHLEGEASEQGRILKGSCRSLLSIDIFKILHTFKDYLLAYGGHSLAAGLTILEGYVEPLRIHCVNYISRLPKRNDNIVLQSDMQFSINELLSQRNLDYFSLLDPFGPGNEKPIFVDKDALIIDSRCIGGRKEHLQLVFRGKERTYKGIGFSLGHKLNITKERRGHEVIYTLSPNRYKGKMEWQLQILDIL